MLPASISVLTICGIEELPLHGSRSVSHVLSVIDPERADLTEFTGYGDHRRTTLRFHDIIDPEAGRIMPSRDHMDAILSFGEELVDSREGREDGHLLIHCHMGISRSTAAMLTLMAQIEPKRSEEALFERLREVRPQAWPNSVMVAMADEMLGRGGRLVEALRLHYGIQRKAQPQYNHWMVELGRGRELEMAL